jgi:hypothetical protein
MTLDPEEARRLHGVQIEDVPQATGTAAADP